MQTQRKNFGSKQQQNRSSNGYRSNDSRPQQTRSNGYRPEQQRRSSESEQEARKQARENAQAAQADRWFQQNVDAMRPRRRFETVMLSKQVVEVVKDGDRTREVKKTVRVYEDVFAASTDEALMLAFKRQPGFQRAVVVAAQ